jgi:hypothetical protein
LTTVGSAAADAIGAMVAIALHATAVASRERSCIGLSLAGWPSETDGHLSVGIEGFGLSALSLRLRRAPEPERGAIDAVEPAGHAWTLPVGCVEVAVIRADPCD